MSVPIPPPDPYNQAPSLWRRLTVILLLAIWPAGALILLLGSAAGEENPLGPGLHYPGRGALVGADQRRDGSGHRHSVRYPRQPEAGGGHHNRGEFARPGDGVGSRPRDS